MIDLTVVTLVTRPANLERVRASVERALDVAAQDGPDFELTWLVLYDGRRATPPDDTPSGHLVMPTPDWAGEPYLRNYALDKITSGHIIWLDDDNLLDNQLIKRVIELLGEDATCALVFDQVRADGALRLRAAPENMVVGSIDTAQVIAPRDLYDGLAFQNMSYNTDGFMYQALFAQAPKRFRFVNEPRVSYNALA